MAIEIVGRLRVVDLFRNRVDLPILIVLWIALCVADRVITGDIYLDIG